MHRRPSALITLSALTLGGLAAIGGGTAAAAPTAPLPSNCARVTPENPDAIVCTWTSGIGNRFTVPAGVTSATVVAVGAAGGGVVRSDGASVVPGGRGGVGRGVLTFTAGATSHTVLVDVGTPGETGQMNLGGDNVPISGAGGAPGGGGTYHFPAAAESGGGGGGYSAVRMPNAPAGSDARIVVGGGGGGAVGGQPGRTGNGGDAGTSADRSHGGGAAGTARAGGAAGSNGAGDRGTPGRLRNGGTMGASNGSGGGGGGGVYGGGGGASNGAGGGGSSTGGSREVSSGTALVTITFALPQS